MKIGSLVELVNDNWNNNTNAENYPVKGKIYTVREIGVRHEDRVRYLLLEEVINPLCPLFGAEPGWKPSRFRELLPPMEISIEQILEEPCAI